MQRKAVKEGRRIKRTVARDQSFLDHRNEVQKNTDARGCQRIAEKAVTPLGHAEDGVQKAERYSAAATRNQMTLISAIVPLQYSGPKLYTGKLTNKPDHAGSRHLIFALSILYSLFMVEILRARLGGSPAMNRDLSARIRFRSDVEQSAVFPGGLEELGVELRIPDLSEAISKG